MVQFSRPTTDITDGGWTTDTGGTALAGAIDETVASDADYIQSSVDPNTDMVEVKFGSITDPLSSTGHVIRYRLQKAGGNTVSTVVALMQGATQIASWTHADVSTTATTYAQTLTGPQADAITDYSDLRLRVTPTAFVPLTALTWAHYQIADSIAGADGTAVSSWPDDSGNGKAATQATGTKQPQKKTAILNGHAVVRADGGDALQIAGLNLSGTAQITHYMVVNQTVNAAIAVFTEFTDNYFNNAGAFLVYRETDNRLDTGITTTVSNGEDPRHTELVQSSHAVIVFRGDLTRRRGKATAFVNGLPGVLSYATGGITSTQGTAFANSTLNLMARNAAGAFQTGDMAFVATAATRHTTDQMRKVLAWLSDYYGIAVTLPSGALVFDGDSNVDGYDVVPAKVPHPQLVANALTSSWDIANFGVAGQTVLQQISDVATQIDPLLDTGGQNILINQGGLNDFFNGGSATHVSVDTVWNRITSYCAARKAAGWTVGQITLLPNNNVSWNAANQDAYELTDRPDINNRIRTLLVSGGYADFVVDVEDDSNIGGTTAYTNTTYWQTDQAHLNQSGQQALANLIVTKLATLGIT